MRTPQPLSARVRLPLLAAALAVALPLAAQESTAPIEQQMSAEEFRATGLHRLAPEELARLNEWLGRTVQQETTRVAQQVAQQTEERVVRERRGFLSAGNDDAFQARIQGTFDGFGKDRRWRLDNGQVWRQTDAASLHGVRIENPQVTVAPGMFGVWFMRVDGYNTRAKVERVE